MSRQVRIFWGWVLSGSLLATGCQPTQPFFFLEDGDLSHYLGVATDIEYPDVCEPTLNEVTGAMPPLTLRNSNDYEIWELTLEEATRLTLHNSQVMRQLGGRVAVNAPETISRTIVSPVAVTTTYDPALIESSVGTATGSPFGGTGPEAALAEFDARLDANVNWNSNRAPQNRVRGATGILFPNILDQEIGQFNADLSKTTAYGTQFSFGNSTNYEGNNIPAAENQPNPALFSRALISDWTTNFEARFSHPLLQGAGVQYNRIAGPFDFAQYANGGTNPFDGVVIARIRTDLTLADFEGGVRNLMRDVEEAYWELYFAYRDLAARKLGRDSAQESWSRVAALYRTGSRGGSADREAQSRSQYFLFRSQVEQALTEVYRAENRLRYIMGLSMSDGRLIRPADEPTTARVNFSWAEIHSEALVRRVEVRKEKWEIKRRELELIAARNHLLPRLDATGTYRWRGLGDNLIDSSRSGVPFNMAGSTAFEVLTSGEFQEWQIGLQLSIPIGYRAQLSTVRHHELLLARERAILQDLELEISHQIGDSVRDVDLHYGLTQSNFNRRVAAEKEVQAVAAAYEVDRVTLDVLLDAQRRRADSESAYYRSLVDYNRSIMTIHYRKGSLLEYNGVFLQEGSWPGKAYFDAVRRARQRDASMYLDYGFTRPQPFSRGSYPQNQGGIISPEGADGAYETLPTETTELISPGIPQPLDIGPEEVPLPSGLPAMPAMPDDGPAGVGNPAPRLLPSGSPLDDNQANQGMPWQPTAIETVSHELFDGGNGGG